MGSLMAGVPAALHAVVGLAGDTAPYVPSAPVQIGTSGPRHGVAEAGSWQALLVMFGLMLVLGTAVLMYAVRQRTRVLERRRVRRMGEAVALMAAMADAGVDGEGVAVAASPEAMSANTTSPATMNQTAATVTTASPTTSIGTTSIGTTSSPTTSIATTSIAITSTATTRLAASPATASRGLPATLPTSIPITVTTRTPPAPPRTTHATPGRPAPNA